MGWRICPKDTGIEWSMLKLMLDRVCHKIFVLLYDPPSLKSEILSCDGGEKFAKTLHLLVDTRKRKLS